MNEMIEKIQAVLAGNDIPLFGMGESELLQDGPLSCRPWVGVIQEKEDTLIIFSVSLFSGLFLWLWGYIRFKKVS